METQKEDLRVYNSLENDLRTNKQMVFIGFILISVNFFIDALFDIIHISTITLYTSIFLSIINIIRIILKLLSIIGTIILFLGLMKLRNNFAGAYNTSLKKITLFLGIGFGYLYIILFIINLIISPFFGIFRDIFYGLFTILGIICNILIILAIVEIKKSILELAKISPTYNTSFLSLYPIIASYIVFSITSIISLIFIYMNIYPLIYLYISYTLAIICHLALGLGMFEIGLKFKQINEYELANLARVPPIRQSITNMPFRAEDENIKDY